MTPCTIGRDDVLCDDDKEIVMMMSEGDKQTANVDYDDNDWRRYVLFYELKWLNLYQYYTITIIFSSLS